jgi:hypothetical protein
MITSANAIDDADRLNRDGKLPLPGKDLPIVVAARMSLSFPFLFTMIPIWAVDYHDPDEPLNRTWFSDGGITSNFPLHRFDSLLPRWPTLGINLQTTDESGLPQRRRLRTREKGNYVYLASNRSAGILDLWNNFDKGETKSPGFLGPDGSKLLGFAKGIFDSAQSWHDNSFLTLPSFRDRVAEIWLTPEEGGLNLDMDSDTIERLVQRGRKSGVEIAERFSDVPSEESMSWQGHRWARFRSGIAGLMESALELKQTNSVGSPGSDSLQDLLANVDAPPAYKFRNEAQRAAAEDITRKLLAFLSDVEEAAEAVCSEDENRRFGPFFDGPRPPVEVGTRARF